MSKHGAASTRRAIARRAGDARAAAGVAATAAVLSNSELLHLIFSARAFTGKDLLCFERVCRAWLCAVAAGGFWRAALARRFPAALAEVARSGGDRGVAPPGAAATATARTAQATLRAAFQRRARAAARRVAPLLRPPPVDAARELARNYRFRLELRNGANAVVLSATFHDGPAVPFAGCRRAGGLTLHTPALNARRLRALIRAGRKQQLSASVDVERVCAAFCARGALEAAPLLRRAPVDVCVNAADGYVALNVLTCSHDDEVLLNAKARRMLSARIRHALYVLRDDASGHEDDTLCDTGEERFWCVHARLVVALPLPQPAGIEPPPWRLRAPECLLCFLTVDQYFMYDTEEEQMLAMVQALQYERV
jgi:hypothetical protein